MTMRYGDLIGLEPIESVIQLLDANAARCGRSSLWLPTSSPTTWHELIDEKLIKSQVSFDSAVNYIGATWLSAITGPASRT